MEMNVILLAEMDLKLLEILAATGGLSERLIEVSLPKFFILFKQNMPGMGMVDRKQGVLKMFCESQ